MKTTKYGNSPEVIRAAPGAQRLACALCGSMDAQAILEKRIDEKRIGEKRIGHAGGAMLFRLWRCSSCDLVRTEPQLTPQELEPYYAEEYWGGIKPADPNWIRRDQRDRTDFLYRFRGEGSVLDVGCGLGFFLRALDARWDRYGVEPMPVPYRQAAQSLGSDRIRNSDLIASA